MSEVCGRAEISIVGLGNKSGECSMAAWERIKKAETVFVLTKRCEGAELFDAHEIGGAVEFFDDFFDRAESFCALQKSIVERIEMESRIKKSICFCVPRSGFEDQCARAVFEFFEKAEFFPGISPANSVMAQAGLFEKVITFSAQEFCEKSFGAGFSESIFVTEIDDALLASEIKLKAMKIFDEDTELILSQNGGLSKIPLFELDRQKHYGANAGCLFVQKSDWRMRERFGFQDLIDIMERLRSSNGCAWDRAQTHESIKNNCIEESFELAAAIETNDFENMCEECGDVLLQPVFHASIARDEGEFDISDVVSELCKKLISRHTHVFGVDESSSPNEALHLWENAKAKEKKHDTVFAQMLSVPVSFPKNLQAQKLQKYASKAGFDFDNLHNAIEEVREKLLSLEKNEADTSFDKIGDCFFALNGVATKIKIDSEDALFHSNQKFVSHFERLEKIALERKVSLFELSEKERKELLEQVAQQMKSGGSK